MMTMGGSVAAAPPPQHEIHRQQQQHQQLRVKRPEDAALHITVSDPVQHTEGMKKFTSYRVDVRPPSTLPVEFPQDVILSPNILTYSAVLRRYSDFFWLFERLHVERAGAIVPPIPEKQPVGRFSPAFVEDRRIHLERFLRRVAVHPELGDAKCLDTFLRADDVTFQAAKLAKGDLLLTPNGHSAMLSTSSTMIAAPPKKEGFTRWFAEAKTSISGDLVKSPDDDLFDEIQRYIQGLDNQMKNVTLQASGLVRKGKELANGLFEFGLAFNLLGQSEADALGDALCKMGETADRLSVLSAEHSDKELAQFEEPLQDYIKMIHSVKLALQKRHEKRLTFSTCVSDVQSKQAQLAKLRAQIGMEAKAYAAEMALRRSQEAADVAREDFAIVSQRVLREVDRFKREKAEEMRRTVLDYINLQVEYNKRMEEIWATLIPQLERVQLDSNSNAISSFGASEHQQQQLQQQGGGLQQQHSSSSGAPVIQPQPQIYSSSVAASSSGMMPQQHQQHSYMGGRPGLSMGLPMQSAPVAPAPIQDLNISVQYRDQAPASAGGGGGYPSM